jgi:hypothetical protein
MADDRFLRVRREALENPFGRALFDALADGRRSTPEDLLDRVPEADSLADVLDRLGVLQHAELVQLEGGKYLQTSDAREKGF